ncbi:penicillin-binding protein activator [Oceanibaculum indicum]|uniref:ABC-type branched-subunit amino acid transport system substrate-binding protein n=1 Tax=Oceanibaculum indicum TaxID=526216 RepID=A0A420WCF2_9PROT|nr:penicillin-binding protein activator [Oceanibaculum indicum]RKQ68691.1 ABC-type branched-subunit amino acid transport system substrate-binding protein [Oceanibaculum indicum]
MFGLSTLKRRGVPQKHVTSRAILLICALALPLLAGCGGSRGIGGGTESGPVVATPAPSAPAVPQTATQGPLSTVPAAPSLIPPPVRAPGSKIKVAILLPLSGPEARIGQSLLNAAQLALFDVADADFQLRPYDTGGDPMEAGTVAQQALADGAEVILGPLFAAATTAVAPHAHQAGVPVLSFSNDEAVADRGIFVLGFLPRDQVARVVRYATAQGITRFAALAPDTPYGRTVTRALQDTTQGAGAATVRATLYNPGTGDFTAIARQFADYDQRKRALAGEKARLAGRDDEASKRALARLERMETVEELPYQAVLLPDAGQRLRSLAPMLAYFDVDHRKVRMLGTTLWEDPSIAGEPTLAGGWYAAPASDVRTSFEERYQQAFGSRPPLVAGLAYDATALMALLSRDRDQPDFSLETLTSPEGFAGVNGIFRLKPDGLNERGLAVFEINNGQRRVIDPAPQSFQPLLN